VSISVTSKLKILTLLTLFNICQVNAETIWVQANNQKWNVTPLLTSGQQVANSYRMAGIPDGLGAFKTDEHFITILMNHELPKNKGIKRAHGANGAFISKWILDIESLSIISGFDQIQHVMSWSTKEQRHIKNTQYQFNKLCSADLAPISAFFNAATGKGYQDRLLLSGEENKQGGSAFAHIVTGEYAGTSYELPHLGKFSWENALANPATGDMTLVAGMDDNEDGQVYFYIGEKHHNGSPVEQAGLANGRLYAVKTTDEKFSLVNLGDVSSMSGDELEKAGNALGVSKFKRPEDGAWDLYQPNLFYFATTASIHGESQIIQLRFDDLNHPEKGSVIKPILNARAIGAQMFDNIATTNDGKLLITEDPGNHEHLSAVWLFDPASGKTEKVLEAKSEFFKDKMSEQFLTEDEENSGLIEITHLVKNASWFKADTKYFLGDIQVHKKSEDAELVEYGQLYLIKATY